jgi:hypothetical protein
VDGLPNDSDILSRIFAGASIYYNYTGQVDCFQTSDPGNDDLGVTGWNWQVSLNPLAKSQRPLLDASFPLGFCDSSFPLGLSNLYPEVPEF